MPKKRFNLSKIVLSGFKSIASQNEPQQILFDNITLIIGANASGKSNLVSFFNMLNRMNTQAIQEFIGKNGFADSLLYYGSKKTARIKAELTFESEVDKDTYGFTLSHASGDKLIFTDEYLTWHHIDYNRPQKLTLGAGHSESKLQEESRKKESRTAKIIYEILRDCQAFQFHDTSLTAKMRNKVYIGNNRFLFSDGGNVAAFLYTLKNSDIFKKYYDRIVARIKLIIPQFGDFVLEPEILNPEYIVLNWREKFEQEYLFGPHQLSDGSMRFIALATLLLQPPQTIPKIIIIDEPELGLHPSAIGVLAEMIKTASKTSQIILATQSSRLIDEFSPEQ
ncbi:MAG: AAA family ATPase, partial [Candidatus Muiribacteriota bacterium]